MLKLYYAPDNASLVVRLALEEVNLAYETVLLDRGKHEQRSPGYLALNPAGLIPTLVTPHGTVSETAACLLWLRDTYDDAGLGPPVTHAKRGAFLRWLFFLSNSVHTDLNRIFYAERFVPADAVDTHHAMMTRRLLGHFDILEGAIGREPALFAPPSALALYLGPLIRWSVLYPVSGEAWLDLGSYPALESLAVSLEMRPSAQKAAKAEGLGIRPFSQPVLPNPPEGSAT
ncbi:MAG: glutathione S-transferase family protein [Pseudomonadota bacterium]